LGGDQGGSIRAPASWCGVLGLKPTHGLVPYVGIAGIDQTLDHCGPMGRTAADVAALLQAIAGKDDADPRQRDVPTADYIAAVEQAPDELDGVRLGVVAEGVDEAVGIEPPPAEAGAGASERRPDPGAGQRG